MPLAGRMKLRTFLMLAGGAGVLAVGGTAVGGAVWGVPALQAYREEAAEQREVLAEQDRQEAARIEEQRIERMVERQSFMSTPPDAVPKTDPAPKTAAVAADVPNERAVDSQITRFLGSPLGTSKRKDVTSGRAYKVNVYQDSGFNVANRAKVDLDRDEKWDEKWTYSDGEISRKVAPNDDDSYTVEQVWTDGAWVSR